MLKVVTLFEMSVLLNDNQKFSCLLASPPTVEALREAAAIEKAPVEVIEALSFFRDIELPAEGKDEATTEITIAGAVLGSIRVVPLTAYRQPTKRGPKKPADNAASADAAVEALREAAAKKPADNATAADAKKPADNAAAAAAAAAAKRGPKKPADNAAAKRGSKKPADNAAAAKAK
jgi:hypothetical protein